MDAFEYHDGQLWCESKPLAELAARFGTPVYVYSTATFRHHFQSLRAAFEPAAPLICFSVKSCANLHILRRLAGWGSGFDVVSGGELFRVRLAQAQPESIVFAGVGKSEAEMSEALTYGVGLLNVESESELYQLARVAGRVGRPAMAALRINPDVDPKTHVYTTTGTKENKFGVPIERALDLFRSARGVPAVQLRGLHLHIGSPVNDPQAYVLSLERALSLLDQLRAAGFELDTLDLGGGFGAHYEGGEAPAARVYADAVLPLLNGRGLRLILEPGRSIAANAGLLLTRVLHVKDTGRRRFVIVDASMTDLIRPALYSAYHFIWPVEAGARVPVTRARRQPFDDLLLCDVVGPVCESGDFLAKDRMLPPLRSGDLLGVFTCGAYGMTMSSQYNSRPRAAEVLVEDNRAELIRRRETYDDLVAAERFV